MLGINIRDSIYKSEHLDHIAKYIWKIIMVNKIETDIYRSMELTLIDVVRACSPEEMNERIRLMISDPGVKERVLERLNSLNIKEPCITLTTSTVESSTLSLREYSIRQVLEPFGEINSITFNGNAASILYNDIISAYFAVQILNGKELSELDEKISIGWSASTHRRPLTEISSKNGGKIKFICLFNINIQNDKDFQVGSRIIGRKGSNMKKILEKCSKRTNQKVHKVIKIRLRGIGSGYKERTSKAESKDPLHLYISAKQKNLLQIAATEIEAILKEIYSLYSIYCISKGLPDPNLKVSRVDLVSGRSKVLSPERLRNIEESLKLSEREIEDLIDLRNEARRNSRFSDADQIREILKRKNIELTDAKGKRGKGVEVTSWAYDH